VAEPGVGARALPESEPFFGRTEELGRLRALSRALARGRGRSVCLLARPGWGKSELLRAWSRRLFEEGEVLPFLHGFAAAGDPARRGVEYVDSFARQCLAFRRRDPSLLLRPITPAEALEGVRAAWGEGGALLADARHAAAEAGAGPDLAEAALVPHRFAALTGAPVVCLLDDLELLGARPEGGRTLLPAEAVGSRLAPAVVSCADGGAPARILGAAAAAALETWRLGPLSDGASAQLLRHLLRTEGIDLDGEGQEELVRRAAGSPLYLQAILRAAAERAGAGTVRVVRAYAAAVCSGEIARFWGGLLAAAIPERATRGTAVEVLSYCLRDPSAAPEVGRLGARMFKPEPEIERALAGLARAGVARVECTRVHVDADPVFRDYVRALYRREFGGSAPAAVAAAVAAEAVRSAPADRAGRARGALRATLATLLEAWDGQQVPAVLFDEPAYRARFGALAPEAAAEALRAETDRVTLPRVVAVASGRVGQGTSPADLEVDALAWGWRADPADPEAEVAWVARYLPGGAAGAAGLQEFEELTTALQAAGDLPSTRLVRWAIVGGPLDAAGAAAAGRLRLATSTTVQVEALAAVLGLRVALAVPAPVPAAPAALELEMTIPTADDAELVAARALEQLAENAGLDPEETGRVKMALVEACINAFEHSGRRDGKVRLAFSVGGGELRIRVENRGRPMGAAAPAAAGEGGLRKRGWGLTLMRELMDEVRLEPREDGVSLVMVKRVAGKEGSGG
jgi:serine/threonine-protein kinase RsbW